MRIRFTKGPSRDDGVEILDECGGRVVGRVPKKGPVPHDAAHLVVEGAVGAQTAFWGRVAAGASFDEIASIARRGGHPSAKRVERDADPEIHELIQAERLVECLEAELWAGHADDATLLDVLARACRQSRVPVPELDSAALERARADLAQLRQSWEALEPGQVLELVWSPG